MVIGRGGSEIDKLRVAVEKIVNKPVVINVVEIRQPDLNAQLVAESIANQLERRISCRRAMKSAIGRNYEARRPKVSRYLSADVSAVQKLRVPSIIMKELFRCRLSVQTLITVFGRPIPHTV